VWEECVCVCVCVSVCLSVCLQKKGGGIIQTAHKCDPSFISVLSKEIFDLNVLLFEQLKVIVLIELI
jgi:hypothetical protein